MTEATRARKDRLTPEEARRALYIDFEGGKGEPPVLLGCGRRTGRGARRFVPQCVTDPLSSRWPTTTDRGPAAG